MKTAISNAQSTKEKARQIFQQGKKQEKKKFGNLTPDNTSR